MSNKFVLFSICLIVFVARHPRYCGFTHGHITDDCQRSNLIGLSPTAGFSGIRSTEVSLSPTPVMAFPRLLLVSPSPEGLFAFGRNAVVRLCGLRSRAESVTYLLYRYSIVKYQWGIFCSSPIWNFKAFWQPFLTDFSKIFLKSAEFLKSVFWTTIFHLKSV